MTTPESFAKDQAEQMRLLDLSMQIATAAHTDQKRHDGSDYITHPEAVALIVMTDFFELMPPNEMARANWSAMHNYVIMAALLHDVLEDTPLTADDLRAKGIPAMVVDIVETVTKRIGENYFDFIMRIMESGNVGAKMVKLADLRHNMSTLSEGSMLDEYRFATYILSYFNKR
jgi:(p)ppGpp synthase/HD superfamily hydrolase